MPISWRETMATGAPALDADHQQLLRIVNAVELAMSASRWDAIGGAFDALVRYTTDHFEREEKIMAMVGFPELDQHKRLHTELTAKARFLAERYKAAKEDADRKKIAQTLHTFVQDWLVTHVIQEDLKVKPLLPKKPVEKPPQNQSYGTQSWTEDEDPAAIPASPGIVPPTPPTTRAQDWGMATRPEDVPKYNSRKDLEYDVPPQFARLLQRLEYSVPQLPPPTGDFESFDTLCEAAIIRRIDKVLVFFQRRNDTINRPLPPNFLASPEFAEKFHAAAIELVFPVIWESRQMRLMSTNFDWARNDTESFWRHVDRQFASMILDGWIKGWDELKLVETKRDGQKVLQVKEVTKRLREILQPSTPEAYDIPKITNREIDIFKSLLDPFEDWWDSLNYSWQVCHDLYEQEKDPRVFQQKARDGALRDNLLATFQRFPEQWSDFLVLTCHRVFPRVSTAFLEDFTRNFGRNESEREAYLPFTMRYLRQAQAHPTFRREERAEEDEFEIQMEDLKRYFRGDVPKPKR